MLKTAKRRKVGDRFDGDGRAGCSGSKIDGSGIDNNEVDDGEVEVDKVGKKGWKTSKSKNLSKSKKTIGLDFFTPGAKLAFTKLRQALLKTSILRHFDSEHYIWIETDVSGYAIGGVFIQLTSDNLGRWHLMAFFFHKMILAETRYKTYDGELLAIVEAFKT